MNIKIYLTQFFLIPFVLLAQYNNSELPFSINEDGKAPIESAILDVQSKDKGILIPRIDFTDIKKISNPTEGLMIFDTEYNCLRIYINKKWECLYEKTEIGEASGNLTGWKHLYDYNESFYIDLKVDDAENVYILSELKDNDFVYLRKYSNKGALLWEIDLSGLAYYMNDLELSNDGKIYITGYKPQSKNFTIGDFKDTDNTFYSFIAKLNTDGVVEDFYKLPDSHYSIAISETGNIYYSSVNGTLGKIIPDGIGDWIINGNLHYDLTISSDEYLFAYNYNFDINMLSLKVFDTTGSLKASKTIESPNNINVFNVIADSQNNFYIGFTYTDEYYFNGSAYNNPINGSGTTILRFDNLLNLTKAKTFEQTPFIESAKMVLDEYGNLYLTGYKDPNGIVGLNEFDTPSQVYIFDVLNGNIDFKKSIKLPGYSKGIIDVSPDGERIYTLNAVAENAKIGNVLLNNDTKMTAVIKFLLE